MTEVINIGDISEEIKKINPNEEDEVTNDYDVNGLVDSLQQFIDARALKSPYYKFKTIDDKFNEYERCYRLSATRRTTRKDDDDAKTTDIIFPDFHKTIEGIVVRAMNIFNSGGDLIEAKVRKKKDLEFTALSNKLWTYNKDCIEDYDIEQRKLLVDWASFGTCVAFTPFKEEPILGNITLDYEVDENEEPVKDDLGMVKETDPYNYQFTKDIKRYTDQKRIDPRNIIVNPLIFSIQKQSKIFLRIRKTYEELLDWEEDGIIGKGQADWIKEMSSKDGQESEQAADLQYTTTDESETDEKEDNSFVVYIVYYRQKEPVGFVSKILKAFGIKNKSRIHRAIICNETVIEGSDQKTKLNRYPFIKAVYIPDGDNFFGLSMGDEMYSVYIAKNVRVNQIFDKSNYEIKGGGLKDSRVPSMKGLPAGMYKSVPGLASFQGKAIMSVNELSGNSAVGFPILETLEEARQTGTGITNFLQGTPTNSGMDDTATGVQAGIAESNARLNAYIESLENQLHAEHMKHVWLNAQENDLQKYLTEIFDEEDLIYTDDEGNEITINIGEVLPDVNIEFTGVKRLVEKERQINAIVRYLDLIGRIGAFNPAFGDDTMQEMDLRYVREMLGRALDVGDLDKLFPKQKHQDYMNALKEQAQSASMENQVLKTGIELFMDKTKSTNNKLGEQQLTNSIQEAQEVLSAKQ